MQRNDRHDGLAARAHRHRLVSPNFCGQRKIARRDKGGQAGKRCRNANCRLVGFSVAGKKFHVARHLLNCFNYAEFHGPPLKDRARAASRQILTRQVRTIGVRSEVFETNIRTADERL